MIVNLAEIGGASVLAGAVSGRAVLSALLSASSNEPTEPEPFFLNFAWVTLLRRASCEKAFSHFET